MSVFVFRINYDEDFQKVRQEILQGRLHQGWGADGMRIDVEEKDFCRHGTRSGQMTVQIQKKAGAIETFVLCWKSNLMI